MKVSLWVGMRFRVTLGIVEGEGEKLTLVTRIGIRVRLICFV